MQTYVSFAPTLIPLDGAGTFRMTLREAHTAPGQTEAAAMMAISLPHGATIETFGFSGTAAYGVADALLARNSLSPAGGFDVIAQVRVNSTVSQQFSEFVGVPTGGTQTVDNSNYVYFIQAGAIAENVPNGQQFFAAIYGFGSALNV